MDGSAAAGLRQQSIDGSPPLQSNFDPSELLDLQIPFVDPFASDDWRFQAWSSSTDLSMLTSPTLACLFQDPYQEPQRIVQLAAALPGAPPKAVHARPSSTVPRRVRLIQEQAIQIFTHRKTKTKHTAAVLAAKYGITPKAIRDIWTRKSWSQATRPYWNNESSFGSASPDPATP